MSVNISDSDSDMPPEQPPPEQPPERVDYEENARQIFEIRRKPENLKIIDSI